MVDALGGRQGVERGVRQHTLTTAHLRQDGPGLAVGQPVQRHPWQLDGDQGLIQRLELGADGAGAAAQQLLQALSEHAAATGPRSYRSPASPQVWHWRVLSGSDL